MLWRLYLSTHTLAVDASHLSLLLSGVVVGGYTHRFIPCSLQLQQACMHMPPLPLLCLNQTQYASVAPTRACGDLCVLRAAVAYLLSSVLPSQTVVRVRRGVVCGVGVGQVGITKATLTPYCRLADPPKVASRIPN